MRVAVLCPGRGSYTAAQLGSLAGLDEHPRAGRLREALAAVDAERERRGDLPVRAMDAAGRFSSRFLLGENAAPLIFAVTAYHFLRLDPDKVRVVAVGGNSMGWYSALFCGGALALQETFCLIETMGSMTRERQIGGQVVYPTVDEQWHHDPARAALVQRALARARAAGHQAGHSIRFGGFAVLWGDEGALEHLAGELPSVLFGKQEYPLRLFGNSAFHSPLMAGASARGLDQLGDLRWRPPRVPLVDGRGAQWRPLTTEPAALLRYTLGEQVVQTFDFTATVRTLLREYAPDRIVLLGPGQSLGGAVAHVLISERWQGMDSREAFVERQQRDPFLLSLERPEQADLVS